ncbi:MAG: SDR family NAD(P)-dependent oxidoreductase [Hyphomicrobiaceae bacterium]
MARQTRTALITGSGRNIGRGCAIALASAGFNVVVNGSRDGSACERVADEVRGRGSDAKVVMADIGDRSAVEALAREALEAFGTVDVLINNAAIRPAVPFLDMTDDDLSDVMTVNCYAAVWLARAFLPGMIANRWGRIINFSGMNAQQGTGGRPSVTMSKHAAWGLTKALSREFGAKGITSNIISPGTFPGEGDNPMHQERLDKLRAENPTGRLGQTEDISTLVAWLCSDEGGFFNGQLLQVNGGVVG